MPDQSGADAPGMIRKRIHELAQLVGWLQAECGDAETAARAQSWCGNVHAGVEVVFAVSAP